MLLYLASVCSADYVPCRPGTAGDLRYVGEPELVVTIDLADFRQTVLNFGASDCWSIQYVGAWPQEKRNAIADLLFETGLDPNGNPRGIGLSLWRTCLGSGSSRNGRIRDPWRRADTFLSTDFTSYEWDRCAAQRWFLQAARARGVDQFLAFVNSPPVNMTKNGRAYADRGATTNLHPDRVEDFAAYLATILAHFRDDEQIDFKYISPINEPQWEWDRPNQEGCPYTNADIKSVVDALHAALARNRIETQIQIPEAAQIDFLYDRDNIKGNQIQAFFDANSPLFVGDKVAPMVCGHSYFTDGPKQMVSTRQALRGTLETFPSLNYEMSEYCILGRYGSGRDLGIDPALYIARTIHYDLTVAGASAWQWWLAVSPYDYKDGLVYIDKGTTDGRIFASKMLWAMGHYSRFIRPGMQRVGVTRSDGARPQDTWDGVLVSAYDNRADGCVVAVLVNQTHSPKRVTLKVNALPQSRTVSAWIPYVTTAADSLKACKSVAADSTLHIPARSLVTLVGRCKAQ